MKHLPSTGTTSGERLDGLLTARPLLADVIVAAALAVPLGGMSLQILRGAAIGPGPGLFLGVVVVLLHVCTAIQRVRPQLAFACGATVVAVLALLPGVVDAQGIRFPPFALPSVLILGLLLFSTARMLGHVPGVVCLAVTLTIAGIVIARLWQPQAWGRPTGDDELIVWRVGLTVATVATTVCVWSLGRLSRLRDLHLAELRLRAERVETDRARERAEAARAERDRISRDLHDVVSHSLAVMVSQAEGGRLSDPDAHGAGTFATIAGVGREALRDMRGLLGVLRSDDSSRSPQPGLAELPALLSRARGAGVVLSIEESGEARRLRPAADLTAYRVIQEGLTNVIKHAGPAPTAILGLDWQPDRLVISLRDTGNVVPAAADPVGGAGSGLTGMAERLRAVGGSLDQASGTADGFRIVAVIPHSPLASDTPPTADVEGTPS